jgi:hypothetical protein
MMKLGDAFRWGGHPPKVKVLHLFFVISDPAEHGGSFVVVNITQDYIRAGKDCVLQKEDHPWMSSDSFVSFRDARLITPDQEINLMKMVGNEVIIEESLDPIVLKKIVEAAKLTGSLAPEFKKYL